MVQALPGGFIREPTAGQDHDIFPNRESLMRDAYVVFADSDFSGIYIRKHPGGTTRAQVDEARSEAEAVEGPNGVRYLEVEDLRVDGNVAWGWIEERHDDKGLQSVEYRAVIPYSDSVTYTVEFTSGKYNWLTRPDSMRFIVTSFEVGKIEWDYPLIGLLTVGALLLLSFAWGKVKPDNQSRNYELHQVPLSERGDQDSTDSPDSGEPGPQNDTAPRPPDGSSGG